MTTKHRAAVKSFQWQPFSKKQFMTMTWWIPGVSPHAEKKIFIADGSIRSGKTVSVIDSFITWAMQQFEGEQFGIAGKSVKALRQNVLRPLFEILNSKGIPYEYNKSENIVRIGTNVFVLYGAPNEAAQDVLQGSTLAGGLIDEAAIIPESFVDQFIGRCSVKGSKIFMTCNPRGPYHWLKTDFIDRRSEKEIVYLHFTMDDNPALDDETKQFYRRMYSGVFYRRNVLGEWVLSEGVIFDMFDENEHTTIEIPQIVRRWYTIDQGFGNATVFLHQGIGTDGRLYTLNEYYHSGRNKTLTIDGRTRPGGQAQKSPLDYAKDLLAFIEETSRTQPVHYERIYIDPAAKGFINQCYQAGIRKIAKAENAVKDGIDFVASLISVDHYRIHPRCTWTVKGFSMYTWDEKAQERGDEKPVKKDDDAMDANRYGCYSNRRYFKEMFREKVA